LRGDQQHLCLTRAVAILAAPAPMVAEREPPVDMVLNGVLSLDPQSMRTRPTARPSVGDDLPQGGLVALAHD